MSEKNQSEFIRKHPKLSVIDLIQEASKQGMTINKNLVYNVRSKDRMAAEAAGGTPVVRRKKAAKKPATIKAKVASTGKKKVSKKAKVAAVKGTRPRAIRAQVAPVTPVTPAAPVVVPVIPVTPAAPVVQSVATMRSPVAIVFFDSDALVKGMREGFPQPGL